MRRLFVNNWVFPIILLIAARFFRQILSITWFRVMKRELHPLPCSQCNKTVKFGPMLSYAREQLGIDKIATGHYARISYDAVSDRYQLRRAVDLTKDQSYFLYDLTQDLLAASIFPLGELKKTETRRLAAEYQLKTADKPESQDLCLVESHGSMRTFLDKYISQTTGDIVDADGKVLGQHQGIHHYTIGQRKGLGHCRSRTLVCDWAGCGTKSGNCRRSHSCNSSQNVRLPSQLGFDSCTDCSHSGISTSSLPFTGCTWGMCY
jgi:tRNA (5-methylaminomethyl-2-thiouridylate)-methyltransferase